ncbi:MAG TPA: hypothetical protein VLA31_08630, partial [Burkholderiaceae bacterium]|nr:hypothetical protein [Burkholderiaceae bacterium]
MSREVCGICWCPYDEDTGACACAPQSPTPPPEAQTEAEKIAYCAGWWDALAKARKAEPTPLEDVVTHGSAWSKNGKRIDPMSVYAEPVQDGCDHCNHPLYAAVKCRVCGRVTEPAEPVAYWNEDESSLAFKPGRGGRWTALYSEPRPCPTCEALARTVMMDQTGYDTAPPQRKPLAEWQI